MHPPLIEFEAVKLSALYWRSRWRCLEQILETTPPGGGLIFVDVRVHLVVVQTHRER